MATAYGGPGGEAALESVLAASRRLWTIAVLGVVAVGCGAIVPAVRAWIGTGHGQAAGYAIALLVGYGYLWLPGPAFAYLRAVGRPRLEGNYGLATVLVNIATTIPLGIAFGATGVIAATTFAYVTTTTWVLRRIHHEVPRTHEPREPARLALALTAAAGVALGGGALLDAALPRLPALAAIGLLALADLSAYFAFMLRATPAVALARLRAGMT
jgi:O-antigen/teichoic acid export membrane protein